MLDFVNVTRAHSNASATRPCDPISIGLGQFTGPRCDGWSILLIFVLFLRNNSSWTDSEWTSPIRAVAVGGVAAGIAHSLVRVGSGPLDHWHCIAFQKHPAVSLNEAFILHAPQSLSLTRQISTLRPALSRTLIQTIWRSLRWSRGPCAYKSRRS